MATEQGEAADVGSIQDVIIPGTDAIEGLREAPREELEKSYELCTWTLTRLMQEMELEELVLYPAQGKAVGKFKLWYAATSDGGLAVELRRYEG